MGYKTKEEEDDSIFNVFNDLKRLDLKMKAEDRDSRTAACKKEYERYLRPIGVNMLKRTPYHFTFQRGQTRVDYYPTSGKYHVLRIDNEFINKRGVIKVGESIIPILRCFLPLKNF